jgi:putative peptidoglycan lipid II flippase
MHNIFRLYWKSFYGETNNSRIFRAAVTIGVLTLAVHLVAIAKELLVAAWFGTSDTMDAFLMAMVIPTFIINVVAGSFHSAFIPVYIQVRDQEGPESSQIVFSNVTLYCTALLILIMASLALLAPSILPIMAAGFDSWKLTLTQNLFYWLLPIVVIQGIIVIWSAVLNARSRFALVAIVPGCLPLIIIVALVGGGSNWGIHSLVVGTLIGVFVEAIIIGVGLRRQGLNLRPQRNIKSPHVRTVMSQYAPILAGAFLMSATNLVDQTMASWLRPGSIAVLNYGNRLVAVGLGLTAASVATAAFPFFSRLVVQKDWPTLWHTLRLYLRWIFMITVPILLLVFVFSEPIVRLLYERGAFSSGDTQVVAQVQSLFVLQIPFYIGGILLVRVISSLKANQVLVWASGLNLIIKIVLNYLFIPWLGVAGIALSTSLMYLGSFVFVFYFVHLFLNKSRKKESPVNGSE